MIDQKIIEEIKSRNPIEEVMASYVTLKRAGANMICSCPFHSEKTPSCTVFLSEQNFYCFGCGAGGDVINFVRKIENLGYVEALEFLARRSGITLVRSPSDQRNEGPRIDRQRFYEMNRAAARFFCEMLADARIGRDAREYLERRQIKSATVRHFGLGYAPDSFTMLHDRLRSLGYSDKEMTDGFLCGKSQRGTLYDVFRDRLMFPVIDTTGNVIAFGGRVIHALPGEEQGRKYINSADTPVYAKRKNLFALNFAKNHCAETMILCEGNIDVVSLHQAGFENAVATLGTAITPDQARMMKRYTKKVIVSYDSDSAGQTAASKAVRLLEEAGLEAAVLRMSGAKDPDEYIKTYGAEAFRKLLDDSRSPFRFRFESAVSKYNLEDVDQKVKAAHEVAELLAAIPSKTERELYLREAVGELGVTEDSMMSDVSRIIRSRQAKAGTEASRDLLRAAAGYGDKVNPDYAKNVQAARAEEGILGMMMLFPEHRRRACAPDFLSPEDFVTEFGRCVFERIVALEREDSYSDSLLGAEFDPDQVSRLQKIRLDRAELTLQSDDVFASLVRSLKRGSDDARAKDTLRDTTGGVTAEELARLIRRKKDDRRGDDG